eukprot:5150500-Amphidinium_carterae.1
MAEDRSIEDGLRFAVLTNFDADYAVGYLCATVNAMYCEQRGYTFYPCVLTKESMQMVCDGRHFAWAKLMLFAWLFTPDSCPRVVQEAFQESIGEALRAAMMQEHDYLVWIDGDAMVLNFGTPLAKFVQGAREKAIVIAEDMSWAD